MKSPLPTFFPTLALLGPLVVLPRVRAQSPLDRIEPYANIYDAYFELDSLDYAFGVALGRVDSVRSVQTNLPDLVNRYALRFSPDSVILDFVLPSGGNQVQREVYRIPLSAAGATRDEVLYRNTIDFTNFTFRSTERSTRYRSGGRLDSIRTDIPAASNDYPGTRVLRRTYTQGRTTETEFERTAGDGRVFRSLDFTIVRYGAGGRVNGGASYSYDYGQAVYEPEVIYNYRYTAARGRRADLDSGPGTEPLSLQFTEGPELTAIETIESGGAQPGSILSRLDDGSDPRRRRYLRPSIQRGVLFEDTWYYRSAIVSTRELPLVRGSVTGANPIQAGGELRVTGFADKAQLRLVDLGGRVVATQALATDGSFAWPDVVPGAYYVVVSAPGFAARAWPWVGL